MDGTISKLQAGDGGALGTFAVGAYPEAAAFDGTSVWVANFGDNTISKR